MLPDVFAKAHAKDDVAPVKWPKNLELLLIGSPHEPPAEYREAEGQGQKSRAGDGHHPGNFALAQSRAGADHEWPGYECVVLGYPPVDTAPDGMAVLPQLQPPGVTAERDGGKFVDAHPRPLTPAAKPAPG